MVIGKVRIGDGSWRVVKIFTDIQIRAVIARLPVGTLVTWPAKILHYSVGGIHDPIELFPIEPANVADPQLVSAWPDRHTKRIAQSIGDDAASIRIGISRQWVVR